MADTLPASLERETGYNAGAPILATGWLTGGSNVEYGVDEREHVPDLMWPNSIGVYSRMRVDGKVAEVLRALTLPILGARRWLDPNGARPEVVRAIADDLGVPVLGDPVDAPKRRTRDRFNLQDHLRLALLAVVYGHMPFEQVYRIDDSGPRPLARLRKLAPRMPETIAEIVTARDGGLVGIRQTAAGAWGTPGTRLGVEDLIPVSRLVFYSHDREGAAWQGRSLLRAAYRGWRMKDEGWRVWATSMRRNGIGSPVYRGAPGETTEQLQAGAKLAQSLRVGETAGAGVPNGADIALKGVEGTLPDHERFVRYCDEDMAGSMLAEFLKLGSSASGSRALGATFVDFFTLADQALDGWLLGVFNEHVIEDLVDLNWGEDEPAPRLVSEDVGSDHRLTYDAVVALVGSGALTPDPSLEAWLREMYRMPARSEPAPVAPAKPAAQSPRQPVTAAAADAPTVGHRVATAVEQAAAVDFQRMQDDFDAHLAVLLAAWRLQVRAPQIDALVEQVRAAVAAGDVAALGALSAPAGGQAVLEEQMRALAVRAIEAATAEAAAQGASVTAPDVSSVTAAVAGRAAAVDQLIAASLASAAARSALTQAGPGADPDAAAASVRADLEGLSDTYLTDQLGGALTAAQNEARFQVAESGPVREVYASELLDTSTCEMCAAEDGQQFASLAAARAAYPTGGYRDCLGGPRCRGTVVVVYDTESPASVQEAA